VFDWLAAGRGDVRGIVSDAQLIRAGDPIRWRRGNTTDSLVPVTLTRRATGVRPEAVTVRFAADAAVAETAPLAQGVYDVSVPGGQAVIAINPSNELLPRAPRVRAGVIRGAAAASNAPTVRSLRWVYALAIVLLCAEWLLRRRGGMR
jgi:hypothetical protein